MPRLFALLVLATAALAVLPATAGAARIYAVSQSEVVWFDSALPAVQLGSAPLSGVGAGEVVHGLDFRPSNGTFLLFTVASGVGRLYELDPTTGAASPWSTLAADPPDPYTSLSGTSFGFDVNPASDRVRIVSSADENLRVNADNGLVTTDGPLNPAGLSLASAYTNNDTSVATGTTLYGYSYANDDLYRQNPPNEGTLSVIGSSDVTAASGAALLHMDIAPTGPRS